MILLLLKGQNSSQAQWALPARWLAYNLRYVCMQASVIKEEKQSPNNAVIWWDISGTYLFWAQQPCSEQSYSWVLGWCNCCARRGSVWTKYWASVVFLHQVQELHHLAWIRLFLIANMGQNASSSMLGPLLGQKHLRAVPICFPAIWD